MMAQKVLSRLIGIKQNKTIKWHVLNCNENCFLFFGCLENKIDGRNFTERLQFLNII